MILFNFSTKIKTFLATFFLSLGIMGLCSCTPRFDNNEYKIVAEINLLAEQGVKSCALETRYVNLDIIHEKSELLQVYSKYKRYDTNVNEISSKLRHLSEHLNSTSVVYCQQKYTNLVEVSDTVLQVLAKEKY